jgi:alpha-L-fucosidase
MDFGNDDNFRTSWQSNPTVKAPWYAVELGGDKGFNTIVITEDKPDISRYRLEYRSNGVWKPLVGGADQGRSGGAGDGRGDAGQVRDGADQGRGSAERSRVKIHRFARVWGDAVRILIDGFDSPPAIAEFGVYDERR